MIGFAVPVFLASASVMLVQAEADRLAAEAVSAIRGPESGFSLDAEGVFGAATTEPVIRSIISVASRIERTATAVVTRSTPPG